MAGKTAILAVKLVSDSKDAVAGLEQTAAATSKTDAAMGKIKVAAAASSAAVLAFGKQSVDAASALQQATGGVQAVFGNLSAEVERFAASSVKSMGLSKRAYMEFATGFGAQLSNLGIPMNETVGLSNELIQLGADLAATYGGTTADAVQALGALFRGEADPIERFNVSIKQSDVNARMAAMGLSDLEGEAKKQAETQARLSLLFEQTTAAQGGFARETGTLQNTQQQATAAMEDAKAAIGEGLLPVMERLAGVLQGVGNFAREHPGIFTAMIAVVGALTAAYVAYSIAATVAAVAQAGLLWPVLLVVAAIAALIAIIYLVISNIDTLGAVWDAVWNACASAVEWVWGILKSVGSWISGTFQSVVSSVGGWFSSAFNTAKSVIEACLAPIQWLIDKIGDLIGWLGRIRFPSPPSWLGGIFGFSATAPEPAAASGPLAARALSVPQLAGFGGRAGGAGLGMTVVNIQVNGALDPLAVGKQIEDVTRTWTRHDAQVPAIKLGLGR